MIIVLRFLASRCNIYFIQVNMSTKQQVKTIKNQHFYPYLSVDPKNKPSIHHDISNCESADYLNIKFDTKSELRDSYFRNFRKKVTSKMFQEASETIKDKIQPQANEKKIVLTKKNILNPQQLIRSQGLKNIKESSFLHKHRQFSHNPKKQLNSLEQDRQINENNPVSKPKCFTLNQISTSIPLQQKSLKRKKQIYQKMLKKVDQLREIYKYQTELMSITEIKDQTPIRFHTEPIYLELNQKDSQLKQIKKKIPFQIAPPRKISPQNRYCLYRTNTEQASGQNRTLQVRKYRNETSIKKRMKYLLRRQLMRQEYSLSDQKGLTENVKVSKRSRKSNEKDAVGPWDTEQSVYFLKQL